MNAYGTPQAAYVPLLPWFPIVDYRSFGPDVKCFTSTNGHLAKKNTATRAGPPGILVKKRFTNSPNISLPTSANLL